MTRAIAALSIILIAVVASSVDAKSLDVDGEIKACAKVSDRDARLACYDSLGESLLRQETSKAVPAQEEVAQAETVAATVPEQPPIPDDFGESPTRDKEPSRIIEYSGVITSCQQGHYGDWYFVFDNGQVWKETNNSRLRFKECNFNATITKAGFGYRLTIEGEEKTYRVRRHK